MIGRYFSVSPLDGGGGGGLPVFFSFYSAFPIKEHSDASNAEQERIGLARMSDLYAQEQLNEQPEPRTWSWAPERSAFLCGGWSRRRAHGLESLRIRVFLMGRGQLFSTAVDRDQQEIVRRAHPGSTKVRLSQTSQNRDKQKNISSVRFGRIVFHRAQRTASPDPLSICSDCPYYLLTRKYRFSQEVFNTSFLLMLTSTPAP